LVLGTSKARFLNVNAMYKCGEGCAMEGNELGEIGSAYKEVSVMITLKK
jgi:hypothetical protein